MYDLLCERGTPTNAPIDIFHTRGRPFTALRRKLPRRSASSRKAGGKGYKLQPRFQCHLAGKCGPKEKSHNLYQWLYHILTFAHVPLFILSLLLYLKAPVRSQCVSSRLDNHLPPNAIQSERRNPAVKVHTGPPRPTARCHPAHAFRNCAGTPSRIITLGLLI